MAFQVPFNRPFQSGNELEYISEAIGQGDLSGDGDFSHRCAELLKSRYGIHHVLLTPSCTAALELSFMLLDLSEGDEVIVPSFTFVTTASAVVRAGGKPVFVDIRPDTLNLNPELVEQAITPNTKAIVPVHYAGVGCEMSSFNSLAQKNGLRIIEDAAQGVHAYCDGNALGSMGDLGTYSFHQTKNFSCGEGGALCINDPFLVDRAEILREKGTNRRQFLSGQVDKYSWVDIGSSLLPSELTSAFLYAQLQAADQITAKRKEIFNRYLDAFQSFAEDNLIQLPVIPDNCDSNYHLFHVLVRNSDTRDRILENLQKCGIHAVFHYVPLHLSKAGQKYQTAGNTLPVTEDVSGRLIRLPIYPDMTADQQTLVVNEFTRLVTGD